MTSGFTSTIESPITNSSTAVQAASDSISSSMKRVAFLKGHTDSVICLNVSSDLKFLASGSEDGVLCIHCLTSRELLRKTLLSKYDSVAAAVFVPHPSSSSSSSGGGGQRLLLFAAAGCELLLLTLEVAAAAASGGEQDQQHQHCGTTAAAAAASEAADLDVLCRSQVTSDDISALAVNRQGTYLAAADDAGDVSIFDLAKLQQQQQQQVLQPLRVIRSAHAPLASAVSFRSHKPWQLLTGGMDNRIACWDFSRANKCLAAWNMTEISGVCGICDPGGGGVSNPDQQSLSQPQQGVSHFRPGISNPQPGSANDNDESAGQLWNPPMVHAMAVPADGSSSSGSGSGRQQQQRIVLLPAAVQKRVVAAARGDGVIAVFDADGDAKPSSSSSGRAFGNAAAGATPALNSKKLPVKAEASASQQQHAATAALEVGASLQQDQAVSEAKLQQQQQQLTIQPGFHVCLGPSLGGHAVPASAVMFLPLGSDPVDRTRFLVSAGEDGRLLLWDWQLALLPQQQQQQQQGQRATPNQQQQQQQQASTGTCLLVDKDHKRKVNALCCMPGGFNRTGAQAVAAKVTSQAVSDVERCLLFVADTSSKISVYEVTVRL